MFIKGSVFDTFPHLLHHTFSRQVIGLSYLAQLQHVVLHIMNKSTSQQFSLSLFFEELTSVFICFSGWLYAVCMLLVAGLLI